MGRWGHDRDDDTDGKPLRHLIQAARNKERNRPAPTPRRQTDKERKRKKTPEPQAHTYARASRRILKDAIRELVLGDPELSPKEIAQEMQRRYDSKVSSIAVANIRADLMDTLRFLQTRGLLTTHTRNNKDRPDRSRLMRYANM